MNFNLRLLFVFILALSLVFSVALLPVTSFAEEGNNDEEEEVVDDEEEDNDEDEEEDEENDNDGDEDNVPIFLPQDGTATAEAGDTSSGSSGGGSHINTIVMIDGNPIQPTQNEPVSSDTKQVQENIAEERSIEVKSTPIPSPVSELKAVVKKPVPTPITKAVPKPEVAPIADVAKVKENKSFIVSLFASIGRLIFRSLPLF